MIVDIDNILISGKDFSGEENYKYFFVYMDDDYKIKPFSIVLPKTSAYVKSYDGETKWMYFLNENDESLEKYDEKNEKMKKSISWNIGNFYILFVFLLITISLLIIVSVYYFYYRIRHRSKQKHTLSYYHSNNKLKEIDINNII